MYLFKGTLNTFILTLSEIYDFGKSIWLAYKDRSDIDCASRRC